MAGIKDMENTRLPLARRVQQGRRATKAGRAMLRLAPDALQRRARGARLALGAARRLVGGARDTDALIEAFERICPKDLRGAPKAAMLLRPLEAQRQSAANDALRTLAQARAIIVKVQRQISGWKLPRAVDAQILAHLAKAYRRVRRRKPDDFFTVDIEALHALRKSVVDQRHHLEFAAAHIDSSYAKRAAALKKLHEHLGEHRDLALLADFLVQADGGKRDDVVGTLARRVAKRQKQHLKSAARLSEKLTRKKAKAFGEKLMANAGPP